MKKLLATTAIILCAVIGMAQTSNFTFVLEQYNGDNKHRVTIYDTYMVKDSIVVIDTVYTVDNNKSYQEVSTKFLQSGSKKWKLVKIKSVYNGERYEPYSASIEPFVERITISGYTINSSPFFYKDPYAQPK